MLSGRGRLLPWSDPAAEAWNQRFSHDSNGNYQGILVGHMLVRTVFDVAGFATTDSS